MVEYRIVLTKQAIKDKDKVKNVSALKNVVDELIKILKTNPFQTPPRFEKLQNELVNTYSRRINRKHRLVYMVEGETVKILSMWTHYENLL